MPYFVHINPTIEVDLDKKSSKITSSLTSKVMSLASQSDRIRNQPPVLDISNRHATLKCNNK